MYPRPTCLLPLASLFLLSPYRLRMRSVAARFPLCASLSLRALWPVYALMNQRWLPGESVVDVAAGPAPFVFVATEAGVVPVSPLQPVLPSSLRARGAGVEASPWPLDGCGVGILEDQLWTLQDKAARMEVRLGVPF